MREMDGTVFDRVMIGAQGAHRSTHWLLSRQEVHDVRQNADTDALAEVHADMEGPDKP